MRLLQVAVVVTRLLNAAGADASAPPATNPAVELARAREMADDAAGAIGDMRAYVVEHPADAAAARMLGDLYFRSGDPAAAEAMWKRELVREPLDGITHARLGALYAAEGRVAEAIYEYDRVMPSPGGAIALVQLHARAGDLGLFLGDMADLADRHRFDPDILAVVAAVDAARHQEQAALGLYSRIVGLRHERCVDLIARADLEIAVHRSDAALDDLTRCLAQEPERYEALATMGAAYLARGDTVAALAAVDHALAVDPSGIEALLQRGILDHGRGDWQAAMRDNEAAIVSDPLRSEGYANLAALLIERHALPMAETTLDAGLRAVPADGRLHYLLGQTFALEGVPAATVRAQYTLALASDEALVVRAAREALRSLP